MVKDRDNERAWKQMCLKVNRVCADDGEGEQTPLFISGVFQWTFHILSFKKGNVRSPGDCVRDLNLYLRHPPFQPSFSI